MTGPDDPAGQLPPADELDELASARLDGLVEPVGPAVADEVARRQARFERVRAVIAEPAAVDPVARESAIAAALAAADDTDDLVDPVTPSTGDELADRRAGREQRRGRGLRVAGIAAAALAVVALGAVVLSGGDPGEDDVAGDAPAADSDDSDDSAEGGIEASLGEDGAEVPTAEDNESASSPIAVLGDLGDFDDVDELLAVALGGVDEDVVLAEGSADSSARNAACVDDAAFTDEVVLLLATATLDGEAVAVWRLADGDSVVVGLASCEVLGRTQP